LLLLSVVFTLACSSHTERDRAANAEKSTEQGYKPNNACAGLPKTGEVGLWRRLCGAVHER
jgi:hypothetical protein